MSYQYQNQVILQNFGDTISNEAYVPPEIEQQNRLDTYNELVGFVNPYHQQEMYNSQRKENIDFSKKAQELYNENIEIAEAKIEKLEKNREKSLEKKKKIVEKRRKKFQEALENERIKILFGTENDKIENKQRSFTKFITERYDPSKRKKNKQKQELFDKDIIVDEKYLKRSRDLADFDWQKIKDGPFYQYQIANYCNKETIVFYPDEQWVPLYDIPDIYMISTYGRLYNKNLKYLIRPLFVEYTALYFIYYPGTTPKYERRKSESIAKMVLQSFCPVENPEKHTVIYIDGDKRNFHLSNLKWKTKNDTEITMKTTAPEWFKNFSKVNGGRQTKYLL